MPTERFYRLTDEKKNIIRDAAIKEFIRVPFEKASINKIIQNANISRGSFYTYFEDKRDVLRYIFKDTKERAQDFCRKSLERHDGDVWKMLEDLLENGFQYYRDNDIFTLSQHVMQYTEAEKLLEDSDDGGEGHRKIGEWIYNRMDKTEFEDLTLEKFQNMIEICITMLAALMAQYYKQRKTKGDLKKEFLQKLEIIKYGMYR